MSGCVWPFCASVIPAGTRKGSAPPKDPEKQNFEYIKTGTFTDIITRQPKGIYTVKKVTDFPVPSRDVSNQTLPGGK
jgi:hypothetical protein